MSSRSKVILVSSLLLACLVLLGLALNFSHIPAGSPLLFIYAGLASVSILSVPLVYWLKIRRNRFEKMLVGEYLRTYETLKDTIRQAGLPGNLRKNIFDDILDLLLSAQRANRSAEQVVGDTTVFAADILDACRRRQPTWWRLLPDCIMLFAGFILGTQTLLWLEQIRQSWFDVAIDSSLAVFFPLVAFIIYPLMRLKEGRLKYWIYILPLGFGLLFVLVAELLRHYAGEVSIVRQMLDSSVRLIPNAWILLVFICLIPGMLLLKILSRKGLPAAR